MDLIEKLGYSTEDKLLIIHADDAGLAHAENAATIQALKAGIVNSYSIMTPCAWFFEIADFAINNPQFDYGIHLTLTCEWNNYKFGPVLPVPEVSSIVDKYGYFHGSRDIFKSTAKIDEVRNELRAQIDRALMHGLNPSHLDSHMYTLGLSSELLELYKSLGREYNLPVLLNKQLLKNFSPGLESKINEDNIYVDNVFLGRYEDFEKGELADYYEQVLDDMKSGLNLILIHPAFNTDEMQAITVDHPNFGAVW
jgi:predicted glycoside hydrolase/deacetylase ChbG (UPF0249 family)